MLPRRGADEIAPVRVVDCNHIADRADGVGMLEESAAASTASAGAACCTCSATTAATTAATATGSSGAAEAADGRRAVLEENARTAERGNAAWRREV